MSKLLRELFEWVNPLDVAKRLIELFGEPGLIWLDSDGSENGRWAILAADPIEHMTSRGLPNDPDASNPFELLRTIESGHWCGWLNYEAGAWVEPQASWKKDSMATMWMARHDPIIRFDLHKHKLWLEGTPGKRFEDFSRILKELKLSKTRSNTSLDKTNKFPGIKKDKWKWVTSTTQYAHSISTIKEYIAKGDIFQANLSTCCTTEKASDLLAIDLFQKLRTVCPAPFAGMLVANGEAKGEAVISTSPERFLKMSTNKTIETRPIKGTRPRHKNPEKDSALAAELISSTKDRAENIMIVDLLRNDLGKICQPGTIEVTQLVGLETYAKVHHLTSVIKGVLKTKATWVDLIEACWPGGSITGAPKIRACKRLYELEPIARGPYSGSFLHLDWNGEFDSNILIRSLLIEHSKLRIHAGCGIVADSNPTNEAEELYWKLMPLLDALQ